MAKKSFYTASNTGGAHEVEMPPLGYQLPDGTQQAPSVNVADNSMSTYGNIGQFPDEVKEAMSDVDEPVDQEDQDDQENMESHSENSSTYKTSSPEKIKPQ